VAQRLERHAKPMALAKLKLVEAFASVASFALQRIERGRCEFCSGLVKLRAYRGIKLASPAATFDPMAERELKPCVSLPGEGLAQRAVAFVPFRLGSSLQDATFRLLDLCLDERFRLEDIPVAAGAELVRDPLRFTIVRLEPPRFELVAKEREGSAHPPQRNAHLMNAFRVATILGSGLIRQEMTLASREDRGDRVIERGVLRQRGRGRFRDRRRSSARKRVAALELARGAPTKRREIEKPERKLIK